MKVAIRVDGSLIIGSGHVMRCLTLADALKSEGANVEFICRNHKGNFFEYIENRGFNINILQVDATYLDSVEKSAYEIEKPEASISQATKKVSMQKKQYYKKWLGCSQEKDAEHCRPILEALKPDWLIIDHYAVDYVWHRALKDCYKKIMVIDDLANREYQCDLLLDQTYGRKSDDYQGLVSDKCRLLLGSEYALLRPEFVEWRQYSLKRRIKPKFKNLLITMGGVDSDNVTGQILTALKTCILSNEMESTILMGANAPYLDDIKKLAKTMPFKTCVKVNIENMAEVMAKSDIAIGAAGATTWERCCMGLPSIQVVLAENQKFIAESIAAANSAVSLDIKHLNEICKKLNQVKDNAQSLVLNSSQLTSGVGTAEVLRYLQ